MLSSWRARRRPAPRRSGQSKTLIGGDGAIGEGQPAPLPLPDHGLDGVAEKPACRSAVSKFAGALEVFPGDLERILEKLGERYGHEQKTYENRTRSMSSAPGKVARPEVLSLHGWTRRLQNLRYSSGLLPLIPLHLVDRPQAWSRVAPQHGEDGAAIRSSRKGALRCMLIRGFHLPGGASHIIASSRHGHVRPSIQRARPRPMPG